MPVLIRKLTFLEKWTYIYAAVGGAALLIVAVFMASVGFDLRRIFQDLADPQEFSASQDPADLQTFERVVDRLDISKGGTSLFDNAGKGGGGFLLGTAHRVNISHGLQLPAAVLAAERRGMACQ